MTESKKKEQPQVDEEMMKEARRILNMDPAERARRFRLAKIQAHLIIEELQDKLKV